MESNEIKQLKLVDKVTKYSFISFVVLTILAILLFVASLLLSAKPAHAQDCRLVCDHYTTIGSSPLCDHYATVCN
jgi:ABC-type phosphate transport system permease subunit